MRAIQSRGDAISAIDEMAAIVGRGGDDWWHNVSLEAFLSELAGVIEDEAPYSELTWPELIRWMRAAAARK